MRKLLVAVLLLLAIAAVVAGVRTLGARDETDAVDARDASELVQEEDDDATAARHDPGRRPEPGTYTYAGSGREEVDVLGGSEHVFPDEIAIVVQLDPDDPCRWTSNVIYVKQHVEERSFCTDARGLLDLGFRREIEFFNRLQETEFTCDDDAYRLDRRARPGATWTWRCRQEGDDATSTYRATFVGKERLEVGGEQVETWHVRISSKQTGSTRGGDRSEYWYLETGLPARLIANLDVTTDSVLGETRFRERLDYRLTSLVPQREPA